MAYPAKHVLEGREKGYYFSQVKSMLTGKATHSPSFKSDNRTTTSRSNNLDLLCDLSDQDHGHGHDHDVIVASVFQKLESGVQLNN